MDTKHRLNDKRLTHLLFEYNAHKNEDSTNGLIHTSPPIFQLTEDGGHLAATTVSASSLPSADLCVTADPIIRIQYYEMAKFHTSMKFMRR